MEPAELDISQEIWKMFGKDRRTYVDRDVFSDDEDMEADATALEREEKMRCVCFFVVCFWNGNRCVDDCVLIFSARIAKREEMAALEEERRHEEEKRQRKKERERAMARGR